MERTFWIDLGVVLYALIIGASLTLAARGGPRAMWRGAAGLILAAFVLSVLTGGVPIVFRPCPLCGYGVNISAPWFAAGVVLGAGALHLVSGRAMPPLVRVAIPAAAALPLLWTQLEWWFS